jgi:hypothetical protein
MVDKRRASTRDRTNVDLKRKTEIISLESPKKRRRKSKGVFDFSTDSEDNEAPAVNGYRKGSSKGRLNGVSERKKDGTQSMTNGETLSRPMATRYSKSSRESASSPVPSESSSDPLTSQRTPIIPRKRPIQKHVETKSSKRNSAAANDFDVTTIPTPAISFEKKLAAITRGPRENKLKRESARPPKTITLNDSRTTPKLSGKAPKQSELESIKSHVLGKLCGRILIPLAGKPAKLAEYGHFNHF